jgi:hypothetical protein
MNLKKIGIVLFLLIAVAGFSMSSVSAENGVKNGDFKVQINYHTNQYWITTFTSGAEKITKNKGGTYYLKFHSANRGFEAIIYEYMPLDYLPVACSMFYDNQVNPGEVFDVYYTGYLKDPKIVKSENFKDEFTLYPGDVVSGVFSQDIINVSHVPISYGHFTFNGKDFTMKINGNFDFGRSDINQVDFNVSYTLQDGTVRTTLIHVIRKPKS